MSSLVASVSSGFDVSKICSQDEYEQHTNFLHCPRRQGNQLLVHHFIKDPVGFIDEFIGKEGANSSESDCATMSVRKQVNFTAR